jgi:hypothetical protein
MPLPERAPPKRRRQILDDETGDARRFNAREYENAWVHEDSWTKRLLARLASLIRNINGGK